MFQEIHKAQTSLDHLAAFQINFLKTMQAQLPHHEGSKLYCPGAVGLKMADLFALLTISLFFFLNDSSYFAEIQFCPQMWDIINGLSGMCHQLILILLNFPPHDNLECIGNSMYCRKHRIFLKYFVLILNL